MFKQLVYIEKSIKNHANTIQVLDKIQPSQIVWIDHYKEVLNQTNSNWLFNKKFQKIVLAKRENEFYYKGSHHTSNLGHQHFYYNTLALNCLYHCEYCYLQGMYNTPHLVLFLNNNDYINATRQLIQQVGDIYMALSYDTDLPALEKYYPYCKEWIEFANNEKNITIEIRTKSHQIDFIHQTQPSDNVLLSFTLSPEVIQNRYEPYTPSLEQRLKAVQNAIKKKFKVMICFDPLIYTTDYKNIYTDFFNHVFQSISAESVVASIGVFRMNHQFFKRIRKNGNRSDIYYKEYSIENKTIMYPKNIRNEMIMFVQSELQKRNIKDIFIYE
ncbi:MAG: DNA photolyase [Bacteroidia bacterium]|nr:DNA photolyase [Bacteroidia bacterium]